jgi:hypothetical protein
MRGLFTDECVGAAIPMETSPACRPFAAAAKAKMGRAAYKRERQRYGENRSVHTRIPPSGDIGKRQSS